MPLSDALSRLTDRVIGLDLHPVAVALAQVTYLRAIGPTRLTDRRSVASAGAVGVEQYSPNSVASVANGSLQGVEGADEGRHLSQPAPDAPLAL